MRIAGVTLIASLLFAVPASSATEARLPRGAYILPGKAIPEMLRQCSRAAPEKGEGNWQPTAREIARLETKLPALLRTRQPKHRWSAFPDGWVRQYVGIVRGGRRFLYGNFVPHDPDAPREIKQALGSMAIGACDGGASFFGAELDVQSGRISHLAFNGAI